MVPTCLRYRPAMKRIQPASSEVSAVGKGLGLFTPAKFLSYVIRSAPSERCRSHARSSGRSYWARQRALARLTGNAGRGRVVPALQGLAGFSPSSGRWRLQGARFLHALDLVEQPSLRAVASAISCCNCGMASDPGSLSACCSFSSSSRSLTLPISPSASSAVMVISSAYAVHPSRPPCPPMRKSALAPIVAMPRQRRESRDSAAQLRAIVYFLTRYPSATPAA
jgi:hypothetical protein